METVKNRIENKFVKCFRGEEGGLVEEILSRLFYSLPSCHLKFKFLAN